LQAGNNSTGSYRIAKPLLTLIFHRFWFRDCVNYRKQPPIKIDDEIFNTAPERLKDLISWAKSEAIINPMKLEDLTIEFLAQWRPNPLPFKL